MRVSVCEIVCVCVCVCVCGVCFGVGRMEGRWNGEATVYTPGSAPEVRVVAVELTFDDANGNWVERQSLTSTSGLTSTQVFAVGWLRPLPPAGGPHPAVS